jgi:hypothetical protein
VLSVSSPPARREHLQALLLALLCSVLFLRDGLLPGRAILPFPPAQMDVQRAEAIAAGHFDPQAARQGLSSGGDKYLQSLCWDRVMASRLRQGEIPLWTRDIAGGAPFVPQMAQVYEPINLLLLLWPAEQWYGIWYLLHQVLFGYFAWRFLRRLGCLQGAALLGLVAACLGLWTQCKLHHNVILSAALPLWPMLSAVHELATATGQQPVRRAIARLGLWTGLSWLSGFAVVSLQVSYLVAGFAMLLGCQVTPERRRRFFGSVLLGLLLGGLLSFAHMIPVLQAAAVSARDASWNPAFLAAHGLEWDHALTALWPDLLAWPADVFYPDPAQPLADRTRMPWSQLVLLENPLSPVTGAPFQSWVETSFAIGTAPLALATLALADRSRRPLVIALWLVAGGSFVLALADAPVLHVVRFLPGLATADLRRLLFAVAMALVVLAALGADAWLRGARPTAAVAVAVLALLGGLLALWWCRGDLAEAVATLLVLDRDHAFVQQCQGNPQVLAGAMRGAMCDGEDVANQHRLLQTAWRAVAVGGLGVGILLRRRPALLALLALTIAELLHAGRGSFVAWPAANLQQPPAVVAPVLAATEPNGVRPRLQRLAAPAEPRLQATYPCNLPGYHGVEDAAGYNPLPAARFEAFFHTIEPDRDGKTNVGFGGAGVGAFHDPASLAHPLCDLFGIRYILTREPIPTSATLVDRTPAGTGGYRLLERTTTLPRATFVRSIDRAEGLAERLALLRDPSRDVANRVVLEDPAAIKPSPREVAPATVTITEHRDERVVIQVACEADGYLRLADPYDAGWRAAVDGYDTPVLVADHYLRAVYLRGGRHEVVFTYDGARLRWPRHISILALTALLWLRWRRRGGTP